MQTHKHELNYRYHTEGETKIRTLSYIDGIDGWGVKFYDNDKVRHERNPRQINVAAMRYVGIHHWTLINRTQLGRKPPTPTYQELAEDDECEHNIFSDLSFFY